MLFGVSGRGRPVPLAGTPFCRRLRAVPGGGAALMGVVVERSGASAVAAWTRNAGAAEVEGVSPGVRGRVHRRLPG